MPRSISVCDRETAVYPKRSLILTFFDYLNQLAEVFRIHIADITDTERVRLGNLARINHKAPFLELRIKRCEIEVRIRIEERGNNRRLYLIRKQSLEAE